MALTRLYPETSWDGCDQSVGYTFANSHTNCLYYNIFDGKKYVLEIGSFT